VEQSLRAIMDIRAQLALLQLRPPRASQIFRLQLRRELAILTKAASIPLGEFGRARVTPSFPAQRSIFKTM